jgi:periplasmic divalent cation tolerance protein
VITGRDNVVVMITADSAEQADSISRQLIELRLAACVSTLGSVNSVFWWQGKTNSEREFLLLAKTRASFLPRLVATVKKIHTYSVPEIIALPIVGGNADYLDWLSNETADKADPPET